MEREVAAKQIEWETVIEYFTKRGRPLSKDEIKKLQDEDERIKLEAEEIKRKEEEIERRRVARLMEDIANEEDEEDFKPPDLQNDKPRRRQRRRRGSDDEDGEYGSENDSDYDDEDYDDEDDSGRGSVGSDDRFDDSDDDLEREDIGAGLMKRSKSSRQKQTRFQEASLKEQTITLDDYMGKVRSNSTRRGKYGITVPKPFKFDMRDKVKPKNIRERKVEEMVAEKQIEQENMIKYQFRPKPVPASVVVPKFEAIMEANEQRRERVKRESREITAKREAPFSFWEREKRNMAKKKEALMNPPPPAECARPPFKANEIPPSCATTFYWEELQQKELEREKRIKEEAVESRSRAKMPERMEHAMKEKAEKSK